MKNTKTSDFVLVAGAIVLPFLATFYGCNSSSSSSSRGGNSGFVQVERLGRPAVNEGLVVTNAFLNAYNSIPPSQDIPVLTANTAFFTEVDANLTAVDALDGNGNDVNNGDVVTAFVPDVMRVDTSLACAVGTAAYTNGPVVVGTVVRPAGGRKLEDDVIDTTLSLLVQGIPGVVGVGAPTIRDNVDYRDATLNDGAGQPDHDLLFNQSAPGNTATFPFLPAPN